MEVISSLRVVQERADRLRREGKRIGVVPTMGYLHEGHLSLIKLAKQQSDVVITTIFVNPTQFGPEEDFERYPRDLERDRNLAQEAGTDILFTPEAKAMYPEGYRTYVEVTEVSSILEGKIRPTHFRGVTTVVAKLLNLTKPHVAVFGQKDAQQAFIIRQMVRDLNIDTEIAVAPIVREADGLAMSSRNVYLSPQQRKNALSLYRSLQYAKATIEAGERSVSALRKGMEDLLRKSEPTRIDYIAFLKPETFQEVELLKPPSVLIALAVRFGSTRLLDNILIDIPS
ncbi:MAG TPA: pantoate--beta-alanine ligase [Bacteroidota bacterium]|nr:pantoate--beta-alanine ligase [Bacteroidota bacterium]